MLQRGHSHWAHPALIEHVFQRPTIPGITLDPSNSGSLPAIDVGKLNTGGRKESQKAWKCINKPNKQKQTLCLLKPLG